MGLLQHSETVILDSAGDLLVVVRDASKTNHRQFLVSSSIMVQSSRVFATMLGPNFQEGHQLRAAQGQERYPRISLDEDDIDAMDFILSILHSRTDRTMVNLAAEDIVKIALQVDKYDCGLALAPWINAWCNPNCFPVDSRAKSRDIGYALLAAYLFRSPQFEALSARYVRDLAPDFASSWEQYDLLSRLPESVWYGLTQEIHNTMRAIRVEVLLVAENIRRFPVLYKCTDKNCVVCANGAAMPPSRCHRGMSEYFNVLQGLGVWPSLLPFDIMSVNKVVTLVEELPGQIKHRCSDGSHCRMTCEVDRLTLEAAQARDAMKGIPLPALFWC